VLLLAEFPQFECATAGEVLRFLEEKYRRNRYAASAPHVLRAYRLLSLTAHYGGRDKA